MSQSKFYMRVVLSATLYIFLYILTYYMFQYHRGPASFQEIMENDTTSSAIEKKTAPKVKDLGPQFQLLLSNFSLIYGYTREPKFEGLLLGSFLTPYYLDKVLDTVVGESLRKYFNTGENVKRHLHRKTVTSLPKDAVGAPNSAFLKPLYHYDQDADKYTPPHFGRYGVIFNKGQKDELYIELINVHVDSKHIDVRFNGETVKKTIETGPYGSLIVNKTPHGYLRVSLGITILLYTQASFRSFTTIHSIASSENDKKYHDYYTIN